MTTPAPSPCCPCPPPGTAAGIMLYDCPAPGAPASECTPFVRIYHEHLTATDTAIDGGPYTPTGTVVVYVDATVDDCDVTTPITTAALCRADGSPIAVIMQRDCGGTITAPGWVDLTTGMFTSGPTPADAAPCDASVFGPTAATTGRIALCDCPPAGPCVSFLRAIDGEGMVTDTTLEGDPYAPTGTVRHCAALASPCAEQTTPVTTNGLCLLDGTPIATVASRDCAGTVTLDGWINLRSGLFTAGNPPMTAGVCARERLGELCADPDVVIAVFRETDGSVAYYEVATGVEVLEPTIVPCGPEGAGTALRARARLIGAADPPWTLANDADGVVTAVTATGLSGTWAVTDAEGSALTNLPAGLTMSWGTEDANTLVPPQMIDAEAASSVAVNWTER